MNIEDLQITLLDINKRMYISWFSYFQDFKNINIVNDDLHSFLKRVNIDCLVSPANGFGIMDGGFDLAITQWYGKNLIEIVQNKILKEYYGEQPVGTSLIVNTESNPKYLIHTPTMRHPMTIRDCEIIYHCMRSTLIKALENDIKSIIIPAFGGATGGISSDIVAYMMYRAYEQILNHPNNISWDVVKIL